MAHSPNSQHSRTKPSPSVSVAQWLTSRLVPAFWRPGPAGYTWSMKTTIDIPDSLYPQIASASAAAGQSIEAFLIATLRDHVSGLAQEPAVDENGQRDPPNGFPRSAAEFAAMVEQRSREPSGPNSLRDVFGTGDHEALMELQQIIDEEFSKIDPEDWK